MTAVNSARISRWGNSLALRIPGRLARELAVSEGQAVGLSVAEGKLVVTPLDDAPSFVLSDLVAGINDANRHAEIGTGPAVGAEIG